MKLMHIRLTMQMIIEQKNKKLEKYQMTDR